MDEDNFFERVYSIARQIPYGRVTTYGTIATHIGVPRSARMVGWSMNATKNDNTIPAHRVVNKNGLLTGKNHFQGINMMQELLESEDIKIENNQIQNFEKVFWMPNEINQQ